MRFSQLFIWPEGPADRNPLGEDFTASDEGRAARNFDGLFRSAGYDKRLSGEAALFTATDQPGGPGCLVLDIRLAAANGADMQTLLGQFGAGIPAIVMTADGCLLMTLRGVEPSGDPEAAGRPARDAPAAFASGVAHGADEQTGRNHADSLRARYAALSTREKQVMVRVAAGRLNKQIAFELGVSEITVKFHRANAMRKMRARTLVDFARMAEQLKLES